MNLFEGVDDKPELSPTRAEAMADRFVAADHLIVSLKAGDKRPNLERLERIDEVWALCVRTPKPGWRYLGRFLRQDWLVLQKAHAKRDLVGNYPLFSGEVIADWEQRFPEREPLRGAAVGDYLSGDNWRDIDADF